MPAHAGLANIYESLRLLMTAYIPVVFSEETERKLRESLLSDSEDFVMALSQETEALALGQLAERLRLLWWKVLPEWKKRAQDTFDAEVDRNHQADMMQLAQATLQPAGFARGPGRGLGASRDRVDESSPYGSAQHSAAHRSIGDCREWSGIAGSCHRQDCHFRKSHILGTPTALYLQQNPVPRPASNHETQRAPLPPPSTLALTGR